MSTDVASYDSFVKFNETTLKLDVKLSLATTNPKNNTMFSVFVLGYSTGQKNSWKQFDFTINLPPTNLAPAFASKPNDIELFIKGVDQKNLDRKTISLPEISDPENDLFVPKITWEGTSPPCNCVEIKQDDPKRPYIVVD